jgi:hypothetical protein
MFKIKVNDLSTLPPNSRWRIAWDSFLSPGQQFYVGMTTGASGAPTFEYGTLADAGVPAVFVISETTVGSCTANPTSCILGTAAAPSNYAADGTITIFVPKSAFANAGLARPNGPMAGDLLGAVNGRTITGDTPGSPESKLERSNAFIDHTFVKAQTDSSYPASTYLVSGNNLCTDTGIAPIGAVSRKTHGSAGNFDIDLPLFGQEGIECRTGGANGDHRILISFTRPVTFATATCGGQPAASTFAIGNTVVVNCTNVPNAQDIAITLTNVSDGTNTGNISIPMGVLLGDTSADRFVNSGDISQTKSQSGNSLSSSNFRADVNIDGFLNSGDISLVKSKSGTALP